MKLYNTVKSLILEVASIDSIVNAIKTKDKIKFCNWYVHAYERKLLWIQIIIFSIIICASKEYLKEWMNESNKVSVEYIGCYKTKYFVHFIEKINIIFESNI